MGAFDGWFGRRSDDPLQDLDPKVREFLEKESPVKLGKKLPEDSSKPAPTQAKATEPETTDKPAVPAESQFQDGRYAHLWKTYRPLAEVEYETKSDQERLTDVLDAFKGRQSAIGAAALENCADEQFEWSNCMKSGSLKARMTMCRDEVRKFEQCYNMQTVRFSDLLTHILHDLASSEAEYAYRARIQLILWHSDYSKSLATLTRRTRHPKRTRGSSCTPTNSTTNGSSRTRPSPRRRKRASPHQNSNL